MKNIEGKENAVILGFILILFISLSKDFIELIEFQLAISTVILLHVLFAFATMDNRTDKALKIFNGTIMEKTRVVSSIALFVGLSIQFTIPFDIFKYRVLLLGLGICGLSIAFWYASIVIETYGEIPNIITYKK